MTRHEVCTYLVDTTVNEYNDIVVHGYRFFVSWGVPS